jgi:hypothetical protein
LHNLCDQYDHRGQPYAQDKQRAQSIGHFRFVY